MPANFDPDLLILLHDVARQMRADQVAQKHGLTWAQMIILARLELQPDVSQNELAAVAEVAPPTIAHLIDRLEELGLVKRCTDSEDRRVWRLRLTPAAAPVLREITRFRARLTNGIDPAILDMMTIGLHQMKKKVLFSAIQGRRTAHR